PGADRPHQAAAILDAPRENEEHPSASWGRAYGSKPLLADRMRHVRPDEYCAVKKTLDFYDRNAMLPALVRVPVIPVEAIEFHACSRTTATVLYIHKSR